jgi:hypothetical protein
VSDENEGITLAISFNYIFMRVLLLPDIWSQYKSCLLFMDKSNGEIIQGFVDAFSYPGKQRLDLRRDIESWRRRWPPLKIHFLFVTGEE